MKRKITITGAVLMALLLALSFGACSNMLSLAEKDEAQLGTLLVGINGADPSARTLAPLAPEGLTYNLRVVTTTTPSPEVVARLSSLTGSFGSVSLAAGTYTVYAEVYHNESNTLIAEQNQQVQITAGKTSQINIVAVPTYNTDVPGRFKWDISTVWDGETSSKNTFSLTAIDNINKDFNNSYSLTNNWSGQLDLPAGVYKFVLDLEGGRGIDGVPIRVYREEVVYIYSGLTTEANYAFTADDFEADIRLSGSAEVHYYSPYGYTYTKNNNYKPVEVIVTLRGNFDQTLGIAPVNEYGSWSLLLPSHYFQNYYDDGYGNWSHDYSLDLQGIQLTFTVEESNGSGITIPIPYFYGTIDNQRGGYYNLTAYTVEITNDIQYLHQYQGSIGKVDYYPTAVLGMQHTVTITTPDKLGLRGDTVNFLGNSGYVSPYTNPDGTITATIDVPSSLSTEKLILTAELFEVRGRVIIPDPNNDDLKVTGVYAYSITGDNATITKAGSDYDFSINVPKGHIWWGSSTDVWVTVVLEGDSGTFTITDTVDINGFDNDNYITIGDPTYLVAQQATPADLTVTKNLSNGLLSNVSISWTDATTTNSHKTFEIQRDDGSGSSWQIISTVGNPYALDGSSWNYTDYYVPAASVSAQNLRYRVRALNTNNDTYSSIVSTAESVPVPTAKTINWNTTTAGTLSDEAGEVDIYYFDLNTIFPSIVVTFNDSGNQSSSNETLTGQVTLYYASSIGYSTITTLSNQYYWSLIEQYGVNVYAGSPLFIVVSNRYDSTGGGTYNLLINTPN